MIFLNCVKDFGKEILLFSMDYFSAIFWCFWEWQANNSLLVYKFHWTITTLQMPQYNKYVRLYLKLKKKAEFCVDWGILCLVTDSGTQNHFVTLPTTPACGKAILSITLSAKIKIWSFLGLVT